MSLDPTIPISKIPVHLIPGEAEVRADKKGFHIEQHVLSLTADGNNRRFEYKLVRREHLPNLSGNLERCHEIIKVLQSRHASSGFDAEKNAWWAHDMPEGGAHPQTIYRWILV